MDEMVSRPSEHRLVLVGLVAPKADMEQAFQEWFVDNHVEDTAHAPHVTVARCYRAVKDFRLEAPGPYLTIYEVTVEDPEEAERILGDYQRDPDAWSGREPSNGSLQIIGAGWYEEVKRFVSEDVDPV